MNGCLYLIPSPLGDSDVGYSIPGAITGIIASINDFIVEDEKIARRHLKKIYPGFSFDTARFNLLNEHTDIKKISNYLQPAQEGRSIGLISDAGCPAVADPGAELVIMAHKKGIHVKPLVGPSSIMLALMASGFNGQNFVFHGYLPKESKNRIAKLKQIEQISERYNQTQIFIETPYRNDHLLHDLICTCRPSTLLCIAADLTLPHEKITSKSIAEWKMTIPQLKGKEVVFLIYACIVHEHMST